VLKYAKPVTKQKNKEGSLKFGETANMPKHSKLYLRKNPPSLRKQKA
jgi:hypothetical protein